MARVVAVLFVVLVGLMVISFVLAHFGLVVLLILGLVLVGRYLRRHGE